MVDIYFFIVKEIKGDCIMMFVFLLIVDEKVKEIGWMIVGVEIISLMKEYVKEFLDLVDKMKYII